MVNIADKNNSDLIDLSIMPSLECNLACPFCMYNCSPSSTQKLDYQKTKHFLKSVDWDLINSMGFYGGEPSINIDLYSKFINLVPKEIPKFTITNGTWTHSLIATVGFAEWAAIHDLTVFISSTPNHTDHQHLATIPFLLKIDRYHVKDDDTQGVLLPMGRNHKDHWSCTKKCQRWTKPKRLAIMPDGRIIFQSCDGVYPIVGTYEEKFKDLLQTPVWCGVDYEH